MKQKQIETALATIVCLDDQESGIIREDSPAEHVAEDLAK